MATTVFGIPVFVISAILIGVFGALAVALWIWMLVDCVIHERGDRRSVWILVTTLGGPLGAVIYLFVRRPHRPRGAG